MLAGEFAGAGRAQGCMGSLLSVPLFYKTKTALK
jgi:hypothetical protein